MRIEGVVWAKVIIGGLQNFCKRVVGRGRGIPPKCIALAYLIHIVVLFPTKLQIYNNMLSTTVQCVTVVQCGKGWLSFHSDISWGDTPCDI